MSRLESRYGADPIAVGVSVAVKTRYVGAWTTGFEVAEVLDEGYRVRRISDAAVLPGVIEFDDVETRIAS